MDLKTFVFSPFGQWVLAAAAIAVFWLLARALSKVALFAHAAAERATVEHKSALQTMLLRASDILATCAANGVGYVEMTMRPKILGSAQGGKLDEMQAKSLRDEAIRIALDQAHVQFGKALQMLPGVVDVGVFAPTVEHLVEIAAQKIGGNSRASGLAQMPPPEMKKTDLSGQPVP